MEVYDEEIFEKLISQIFDLSVDIEKNAYEFDPDTEEANFWYDLSDEMQIIYKRLVDVKLESLLPF